MSLRTRSHWAAVELPETAPEEPLPTEFRIFVAGVNPSSKGSVLFDADAATSVITAWQTWGVDIMIDLNHESLDMPVRADSGDARGWCQLEVRDGELWAVGVRWTADGERRLREKTQRYISPAFMHDEEEPYRVSEVLNIALVAMPATHDAPALMAASRLAYRQLARDAARRVAARERAARFLNAPRGTH